MGVKQSTSGRFCTIEKIYGRILFYKNKSDVEFILKEQHRVALDDKTIISFVSPNYTSLVRKKDDGYLYTEMIPVDEAIKILSPYLRKQKLKKIMG